MILTSFLRLMTLGPPSLSTFYNSCSLALPTLARFSTDCCHFNDFVPDRLTSNMLLEQTAKLLLAQELCARKTFLIV